MATATLYERTNALEIIAEWIEEHQDEILAAGGELPPELAALLDEAELDFKEKAERVALYVRELLAEAEAIKAEETRLAARRKARERSADGLKAYLHAHMTAAGIDKVKGLLCTVAVQKSPAAVVHSLTQEAIRDAWLLGAEWAIEVPASFRVDSRLVLETDKAGHAIPDGVTIVHGSHVRIR